MDYEKVFIKLVKSCVDYVENQLDESMYLNEMQEYPIKGIFGKEWFDRIFDFMFSKSIEIDEKEAERLINLPISVLFD